MSLRKAIEHGKECRKPYRGCYVLAGECRCFSCRLARQMERQFTFLRDRSIADDKLKEYQQGGADERNEC